MAAKKKKKASSKKVTTASKARDHLGRLPAELFCLIVQDSVLSIGDLAALAATCRKCYVLTNRVLYQKHLNEDDGQGLLWAVAPQRFTTITRFLENGADINKERRFGVDTSDWEEWKFGSIISYWDMKSPVTPLALAAVLGLDNMVAFLLDNGADIEKPVEGLDLCAKVTEMLWLRFPPHQIYETPEDDCHCTDDLDWLGWTPLHYALCRHHESTAMLLLERGANPQAGPAEAGTWNKLHTATQLNQRKVIDYILDNKLVDINEPGPRGLTPLLLAYYYDKHDSLVDMYIDRGADINAVWHSNDGDWTIFAMACLRDDFSRASDLLRRGADPDFVLKDSESGAEWTALGLIYGNLYGEFHKAPSMESLEEPKATKTRERRMLEEQIIQAKLEKALQQSEGNAK